MLYSLIALTLSLAVAAIPTPSEHPGGSVHLEPAESSSLTPLIGDAPVADATAPQLLTCQAANCASCTSWLANDLGMSNCFWAGAFTSVQLVDPSRFFAPGVVDIAPDNCINWLAIPQQGICYNIVGATFHQFGTFHV
ncbi:hypothetical protein K466DRAFT_587322 [Polyporus arcularius HHB13444]|uniref:Uncharacterized protein n=1 Tax=Polyporus arcularius HHB13444 TaxID=1314778 RepID=A0A5C3PAH1_9APHY|nr:hypothetical protein K466DRAFT_587322 [Polyporus arcularius HHB13444]